MQTRVPLGPTRRTGFTLIELLVVIAIISILASMLFPTFARAREQARKTVCVSNMKQIGLGILQYTQDYDETYPIGFPFWASSLSPSPPVDRLLVNVVDPLHQVDSGVDVPLHGKENTPAIPLMSVIQFPDRRVLQ
jgi:prepilin-type N-terminal cleavage/methylation domain-containing protein